MKSLKVNVNFSTGIRAGNIDPVNDKNLWTEPSWQDVENGFEFSLVLNGDVTPYEGKEGVVVLEGLEVIQNAIEADIPPKTTHFVSNKLIMDASFNQAVAAGTINFEDLPQSATAEEELAFLYASGVKGIGIQTTSPRPVAELAAAKNLL